MRAEFRIWHEGGEMFYAMFERGQKASGASLIRCDQFPAASESINALMPKLIEAASNHPELKNRWYSVEFLSTLSGEMLVTMIYHKKLNEAWQQAAQELAHNLGIHIIGRSRGQKIVLSQDFVTEALTVNGKTFRYRQIEGSFTQPNAQVCQKMLTWACDAAQNLGKDMLELYCGNGNFTCRFHNISIKCWRPKFPKLPSTPPNGILKPTKLPILKSPACLLKNLPRPTLKTVNSAACKNKAST